MPDFAARTEQQIALDAQNALIAQTGQLTDLAPQSGLRVLADACLAPEIAHLNDGVLRSGQDFYVQTATGDALDRRLADFGLARPQAAASWGLVRFTREAAGSGDVVISEGLALRARDADGEPIDFSVRAEITLPDGEAFLDVMVDADEVGSAGNVGASAINEAVGSLPAGIASVSNTQAFTPGRDEGTDEEARAVFFEWLGARARGTVAALSFAALTYADEDGRRPVQSVYVEEHLDAPGPDNEAATIYLAGHSGTTLNQATKDAITLRLDGYTDEEGREVEGYRIAGQLVRLLDPVLRPVTVRITLTLSDTGTQATRDRLARNVTALMTGLPTGVGLTRKALYDEVCKLGGEITNVDMEEPPADVPVAPSEKIVVGQVAID